MKKSVWFSATTHRWVWRPSSLQGWLIVIMFFGLVLFDFLHIDRMSHSISDTLIQWIPDTTFLAPIIAFICTFTIKQRTG